MPRRKFYKGKSRRAGETPGLQEHAEKPAPDPYQDIDADVAGQKSDGAQDGAANDIADEVQQFVCVKSSKHKILPFCLCIIVKIVQRGRCGFAARQALVSYEYNVRSFLHCKIYKEKFAWNRGLPIGRFWPGALCSPESGWDALPLGRLAVLFL